MASFFRYGRFRAFAAMLALGALSASMPGCVERRMTIRSNPDGAMVYVDDYEIGTTPVSVGYTYYGTRKIRLVKDGYETMTVYQPMPTPWYEWFGVDFFSENVWPGKIRDERSFNYQMTPTIMVPTDQLLSRAEQLRAANRAASAAEIPPPAAAPIGLPASGVALPQPATLPPPVSGPAGAVPPSSGAVAPAFPAPMPGAIPNYAPPGGVAPNSPAIGPAIAPQPYLPAGTSPTAPSTYPNYPLPGGASTGTPGGYPGYSAPTSPPVLPPDWRPMGQAPGTSVQR